MLTFLDVKEELKEEEKFLDSQLWHACAGGMVQMPSLNSKVFYFPQGHAEHASGPVDFKKCLRFPLPPCILCRVDSVKYMADPDTDELYAKLRLVPLNREEANYDEGGGGADGSESQERLAHFAKILTQSDANNGGGFSVPRFCADTIFPPLNFKAVIPLQYIEAKDVHGESWKFKHIYRGTPRRHLLTTGWSPFVNKKRLVAGDSLVFLCNNNKDIYVAVRRAKRRNYRPFESSSLPCRRFSASLIGNDSKKAAINNGTGNGKVKAEAVIEAANLAAEGLPFEVAYYPRVGTPEFCVKASSVKTALQIRWCSGMRFKMAFEAEDSRISCFMGTISSVQVADSLVWPNSPWRLLQVTWDEPGLVQDVKRVNPWLVQLVSNMPTIPPPFSPPRKRMRLPQHPDFPLDTHQIYAPTFVGSLLGSTNNPFGYYVPETTPAGMQGARHAYCGLPLVDFDHLNNLQLPLYLTSLPPLAQASMQNMVSYNSAMQNHGMSENVSHFISNENSAPSSEKQDQDNKTPHLRLFGKKIIPSTSCSEDSVSLVLYGNAHKGPNFFNGESQESDQSSLEC